MADKVDQIMEYMLDEFNFYKQEKLFSTNEIRNIVKARRSHEYQMFRKDAQLIYFIDAIQYERQLWQKKSLRKKNQKNENRSHNKFDIQDQAIKRRIIHLYQRATRKFKYNLALQKEYLHFLFCTKSSQKLNRVISTILQLHPTVVDFWIIAAYNEMDLKGNLFNGRKIFLQGLRNNDQSSLLHVEYFKYEVALLEKIRQRQNILLNGVEINEQSKQNEALEFIEDSDHDEHKLQKKIKIQGELNDASQKFAEIVFDSIEEKFKDNVRVFRACWKDIVKINEYLSQDFKEKVQSVYQQKKSENIGQLKQFLQIKMEQCQAERLLYLIENLWEKYIKNIQNNEKDEIYALVKQQALQQLEKNKNISEIILYLIKNYCSKYEDKLELILKFKKQIQREQNGAKILLDLITHLCKEFEIKDDIISTMLMIQMNKKIEGDHFKIRKEMLVELQLLSQNVKPLSNEYISNQQVKYLGKAKAIILQEMLNNNQSGLALAYFNKCIQQFGTYQIFVETLFQNFVKILLNDQLIPKGNLKQHVEQILGKLNTLSFTKVNEKMFDKIIKNLQIFVSMQQNSNEKDYLQINALINCVFQTQLESYGWKTDLSAWKKYLSFLFSSGQLAIAETEYKRALEIFNQDLNKSFFKNYNNSEKLHKRNELIEIYSKIKNIQ